MFVLMDATSHNRTAPLVLPKHVYPNSFPYNDMERTANGRHHALNYHNMFLEVRR
jgi:hypothetical protein